MWRLYAPDKTVSDLKLLLDERVLRLNSYIKPKDILIGLSLSDKFSEHWYIFLNYKKNLQEKYNLGKFVLCSMMSSLMYREIKG